jgi:hypothetical protein
MGVDRIRVYDEWLYVIELYSINIQIQHVDIHEPPVGNTA